MAQVAPQHRERELRPSGGGPGHCDGPRFRRLRQSGYQLLGAGMARLRRRGKGGFAGRTEVAPRGRGRPRAASAMITQASPPFRYTVVTRTAQMPGSQRTSAQPADVVQWQNISFPS